MECSKTILGAVAEAHGITLAEIIRPTRAERIAQPRQMATLLMRELTYLSTPQIGREIVPAGAKPKDHTTVLYSVERARERCRDNPQVNVVYQALKAKLSHSPKFRLRVQQIAEERKLAAIAPIADAA